MNVNKADILTPEQVKERLSEEFQYRLHVFNQEVIANKLSDEKPYDHQIEFVNDKIPSKLPRTRIYPMSRYKLKQVKKYLNKNLKKDFIVSSKVSFASPVLFAEKLNEELRFCVDYRRLNKITKKNKYSIPLVNKVLARVQGYKYFTRLDIIAVFNKLRMHSDSEDYIIFVTSLGVYKYRVLLFELTNGTAIF